MRPTPRQLRARENALFDALEHTPGDRTFLNRLYRDDVPTPKVYLAQRVRALFVFREPNMGGTPYELDMRNQVSDERFRPRGRDGKHQDRSVTCWWNLKAGMFAHAVAAALDGELETEAFDRFAQGGWHHEVVSRYAYLQIKKVGGGGTANADEICAHAAKYSSRPDSAWPLTSPTRDPSACGAPPDPGTPTGHWSTLRASLDARRPSRSNASVESRTTLYPGSLTIPIASRRRSHAA